MDRLTLSNWRAFKFGSFDFSKINIFVGPNNSGKSSALSALNVLAQTINPFALNSGPLVLNGPYDQLGTYKDTVHGGFGGTPIRFACRYGTSTTEWEIKYRPQRREIELTKFKISDSGLPIYEYSSNKARYDVSFAGRGFEELGLASLKRRPDFRGFFPMYRIFELRRALREKSGETRSPAQDLLLKCDHQLTETHDRFFGDFVNYESLGPFRVQPQRTYLFSGETVSGVGRNGENTIALLAHDASKRGAERVGYLEIISNWLVRSNISPAVSVKNLTDRHYEISLKGPDGKDHNIRDVGFGISQVLPVLVAGIKHATGKDRRHKPMLVVQEPEIHLHPNAQAELGTFFVSVAKLAGQIFIETHSDSLVLRIARHVALGDLDPDDVRVYYVSNSREVETITRMGIDETGSFTPDWPGDFFPQRQIESFELARASVARSRGKTQKQLSLFEF